MVSKRKTNGNILSNITIYVFLDYMGDIHTMVEGQKPIRPQGAFGVVGVTLGKMLVLAIFLKAGAFDQLF